MILVTVGTQLPFDRLIEMIDSIAPALDERIVAQTGDGAYRPRHIECTPRLTIREMDDMIGDARVIVSHAGIGTVLRAHRENKPLILVPRLAKFGEHRDNHQVDTCAHLGTMPGIHVAEDAAGLRDWLGRDLPPVELAGHPAGRATLVANLRAYLSSV